jgi:hypothetical protein
MMQKIYLLILCILSWNISQGFGIDSLRKPSEVKRYIRPCIFANAYTTPNTNIEKKHLNGEYKFSQFSGGFYLPVFTSTWFRKDEVTLSNFHLLLTGNLLSARPYFSEFEKQHKIYKFGIGLRGIYNTGKKNIWFMSISPFAANDEYTVNKPTGKLAMVFLLNRTVNRTFSYRIGFLRTFVFGKKIGWPIIGFRFGPLDGNYFSIQLPKNISYNFPIGKKINGSIFIKPIGGAYSFKDNLKALSNDSSEINFGRSEFLIGLSANYRINNDISLFASSGFSTRRELFFGNKKTMRIDPAPFLNIGFSWKLGRAKRVYNDINMYDVFDLNNSFDPGNDNEPPIDNGIPRTSQRYNYKDVQDLITEDELY